MHCKLPRKLFIILFLTSVSLLVAGCASNQTPLKVETPTTPKAPVPTQATTHALDEDKIIGVDNPLSNEADDPWDLVESSMGKAPTDSNPLLLKASELFLNQQHYSTAYTMFEEIDPGWLDSNQMLTLSLIRARYALLTGDNNTAASLVARTPANTTLSKENYARLLKLTIALATQQSNIRRVVLARIELDTLLRNQAQLANQLHILKLLSDEPDQFRRGSATAQSSTLKGWLALAELSRRQQLNETQTALWRQQFPEHPAQLAALINFRLTNTVSSRQIALLLPITSKLGRAAQIFKAGFDAAVNDAGKTVISRVYDIGSESELVGLYYQSAVNDGADFIIGPLGRSEAQAMLTHLGNTSTPGVSTLLLGELSPEYARIPRLWGLSLSPEQEAVAIAERAVSQGMRSALILQKNNPWGTRLSDAFSRAFAAKGGTVIDRQRFEPGKADPTTAVKRVLDIDSSAQRHKRLQSMLGTKLQFSVRRRNDVDFIFLAGNAVDARRIVPLAKFYRAHDLPIYATSSVYNGRFNKLTDEDMAGLQFADLPWLLDKQVEAQLREKARIKAEKDAAEAKQRALAQGSPAEGPDPTTPPDSPERVLAGNESPDYEGLPYPGATLNRLYALGYAAFEIIPQLSSVQAEEWNQYRTQTMSLRMDSAHNLRHRVAWGEFTADGVRITP